MQVFAEFHLPGVPLNKAVGGNAGRGVTGAQSVCSGMNSGSF